MWDWQELIDMGLRQRAYWLRQADAIRRRMIITLAHAARIGSGMMGEEDQRKAIDELELSETKEESKEKQSQATWDMLYFLRGGKGV